ncbi:MAG: hypothetical protein ACQEP8_05185 [Chlamydiota bacterium]
MLHKVGDESPLPPNNHKVTFYGRLRSRIVTFLETKGAFLLAIANIFKKHSDSAASQEGHEPSRVKKAHNLSSSSVPLRMLRRVFPFLQQVNLGKSQATSPLEAIYQPTPSSVERGSTSRSEEDHQEARFVRFIKRFVVYHSILEPELDQHLQKALKDIEPENLRDNLPSLMMKEDSWLTSLKDSSPKVLKVYEESELKDIYRRTLLQRSSNLLRKKKLPSLNSQEKRRLQVQHYIRKATESSEKTEDFLKGIHVSELDVQLLASIPISEEGHREFLKDTWVSLINHRIQQTGLSSQTITLTHTLKPSQIQATLNLLDAINNCPSDFKSELPTKIEQWASAESLDNLKNSLISNHTYLEFSFGSGVKATFYRNHLKQLLEDVINKHSESDDPSQLASLLAFPDNEEDLTQFITKAKEGMGESPKLNISDDELRALYFYRLEQAAISRYYLTDLQVENLRNNRVAHQHDNIASVTHLLYNEQVIEDIQENGLSHPAHLPNEVAARLVKVARAMRDSSGGEDSSLFDDIKYLAQYKGIDKIINQFEGPKLYESLVPSILHRFIPGIRRKKFEQLPAGIIMEDLYALKPAMEVVREYKKLSEPIAKAGHLLGKYSDDRYKDKRPQERTDIFPHERLTYSELGCLSKLQQARYSALFKKAGLENLAVEHEFYDLRESVLRGDRNLCDLENILGQPLSKHCQRGDFLAHVGRKEARWKGGFTFDNWLISKVSKYGLTHGAKIFFRGGRPMLSHIKEDKYSIEELSLYRYAISDIWHLDITSLIPEILQGDILNSGLNSKDWAQMIKDMYLQAEEEVQQERSTFESIENDMKRMILSGFANFTILGHRAVKEQDFEEIYKQFKEDEPPNEQQICSEFASKSSLAALMLLNEKISGAILSAHPEWTFGSILSELQGKGITIPPYLNNYLTGGLQHNNKRSMTKKAEKELRKLLSQQGYQESVIEMIIRANNQEILDLPYSRRERFERINPGRMISILEKKGCVKKRKPDPTFNLLIRET